MPITFVKDASGKVIVDDGSRKYSLDPSMNIIPHPQDSELIIVTDSSAPLEQREVLKFGWQQVSLPVNSSRNDLVEKLGKNFFYSSLSVSFPSGLATEAKQDAQIVLETAIRDYLDTVETKLASIITNTTGLNLEATQIQVRDYLDTVETKLASIITNTTGLGLETTLQSILLELSNIESYVIDVVTNTTGINLEATQIQIRDYLDTVETKLQSLLTETEAQDTFATSQDTSTVAASVTSVTLQASNTNRRQITITNKSVKTLWICFFTPATSATPFFLGKDESWVFDRWKGAIYGIWDTGATGNAYVTEEIL